MIAFSALALPSLDAEGLEGWPLFGALTGLALLDSTSFGTLLIPIWLLLVPGRVRSGRMLIYLATIVVFYFAVGLLLALGASTFLSEIRWLLSTPVASWAQFILGVLLIVHSFSITKEKSSETGKLTRWRARAMGAGEESRSTRDTPSANQHASPTITTIPVQQPAETPSVKQHSAMYALMGLALAAAAIELASMLPYLAGIAIISTSGVGWPASALLLAGYCIVMVLPALVLLSGRILAAPVIEPLLQRIGDWLTKHAAETTAWIIGILGFLLAREAGMRIGLFDWLSS